MQNLLTGLLTPFLGNALIINLVPIILEEQGIAAFPIQTPSAFAVATVLRTPGPPRSAGQREGHSLPWPNKQHLQFPDPSQCPVELLNDKAPSPALSLPGSLNHKQASIRNQSSSKSSQGPCVLGEGPWFSFMAVSWSLLPEVPQGYRKTSEEQRDPGQE